LDGTTRTQGKRTGLGHVRTRQTNKTSIGTLQVFPQPLTETPRNVLIGHLGHSLLKSGNNGTNQLNNGHQETAVGTRSQMIPGRREDRRDNGTTISAAIDNTVAIDGKVPFGDGHADNHVAKSRNESRGPKETKEKEPTTVFGKVVVRVGPNSHLQVTGRNGIGGHFNVAQ
jgi:hypothetical protein